MKIDLSFKIEKKMLDTMLASIGQINSGLEKAGHIGTHFDIMDKEFSIENILTKGKIFDISNIKASEINVADLDLSSVQQNDFVIFHSGILKKYGYGTKEYFSTYIELSDKLIDYLIDKKVSFIGVDMAGIKKPENHPRADQYCADSGIFIIENLSNLDLLLEEMTSNFFTVYTFPVNMSGFSGLPCRVIAEV